MKKGQLIIEDAKLLYRHFAGTADDFHREGERDFSVRIDDPQLAERLAAEGWNVRERTYDDGEKFWHVKIKISYKFQPPAVGIVRKNGEVFLEEKDLGMLDHAEILRADLIIDPSVWNIRGETGVTGYLRALHVRIQEDPFMEKYKNGYGGDEASDDNPF